MAFFVSVVESVKAQTPVVSGTATVADGATTTLTCTSASSPLVEAVYQWKEDGTTVDGAFSNTYTTPSISMESNGITYTCAVMVDGVTSDESTAGVTLEGMFITYQF